MSEAASSNGGADVPTSEPQETKQESMEASASTHHGNSVVNPKPKSRKKIKIKHLEEKLKKLDRHIKKCVHSQYDTSACSYTSGNTY